MNVADYLLQHDVVSLQAEAPDWRASLKLGTDMLEKQGSITSQYYSAICSSMEKIGPYFLLGPGLAMPHARPEQGVLTDSFALVTLATPVTFGDADNDPVDILITMAANSSKQQNESAIVQIVGLLDDEQRVAQLRAARSKEDLHRILVSMTIDTNT